MVTLTKTPMITQTGRLIDKLINLSKRNKPVMVTLSDGTPLRILAVTYDEYHESVTIEVEDEVL